MGIGYQRTDRKVIDYDLWFINNGRHALRGPRVDYESSDYICFIGAAQTFGRFVKHPFPYQVGRTLGKKCLNLGFSGAGPEYYLRQEMLMRAIEGASVLVVQSMSARSVSAGVFRAGANNGVLTFLEGPRKGEEMLAQKAYQILRDEYGQKAYDIQVAQAREEWVRLHEELLAKTNAQKYFLWLSEKKPEIKPNAGKSAVGTFPHFVTSEMVERVSRMCDGFIDGTFVEMEPQPLVNDKSAKLEEVFAKEDFPARPDSLRSLNVYYSSPKMHDFASSQIIKRLLKDNLRMFPDSELENEMGKIRQKGGN